ncbi:unnamed protein product [Microthlaspi erraticum]|uniref:Uncharacterized protein n=1 Tax=Microthlaspi erraticum TaxID=1685480 RepID=A0A6D2I532_9BRAS|nr:unnamed protein product [Microthlaspi erraticum]
MDMEVNVGVLLYRNKRKPESRDILDRIYQAEELEAEIAALKESVMAETADEDIIGHTYSATGYRPESLSKSPTGCSPYGCWCVRPKGFTCLVFFGRGLSLSLSNRSYI